MSYQRKRRRFLHDFTVGRFTGGERVQIDEAALPLFVQQKLANLRQELGQLSQALALRNLDLLELRRELRVMHRFQRRSAEEQAVLDAAGPLIDQQDTGDGINRDFYAAFDALRRAVVRRRGLA